MTKKNTSPVLSIARANKETFLFPSSGEFDIPMTNDYLFRALLQENEAVRCELIRDLLHLDSSIDVTTEIQNPIELGKSYEDKYFILDIKVCVNGEAIVDLEMQVINEGNWTERSLTYLCRNFDQLKPKQDYKEALPVCQIGLLNFTLFKNAPEFYATYKMMNIKNHLIYSDKLQINVLDLTQIELATDEDKSFKLDYWAKLFKAKTWEEAKMLAEKKPIINEACHTVYKLTQEEEIRMQCEAREDFYRTQAGVHNHYQKEIKQRDEIIAEKDKLISELQAKLAEVDKKNL